MGPVARGETKHEDDGAGEDRRPLPDPVLAERQGGQDGQPCHQQQPVTQRWHRRRQPAGQQMGDGVEQSYHGGGGEQGADQRLCPFTPPARQQQHAQGEIGGGLEDQPANGQKFQGFHRIQRAPLPVNTTRSVWAMMRKSRKRLQFLT